MDNRPAAFASGEGLGWPRCWLFQDLCRLEVIRRPVKRGLADEERRRSDLGLGCVGLPRWLGGCLAAYLRT